MLLESNLEQMQSKNYTELTHTHKQTQSTAPASSTVANSRTVVARD